MTDLLLIALSYVLQALGVAGIPGGLALLVVSGPPRTTTPTTERRTP